MWNKSRYIMHALRLSDVGLCTIYDIHMLLHLPNSTYTFIQVNKFIGRLDLGCSHSDYTIMSPLTILSLKVRGPRVQTVPFDKDPLIDAI